MLNLYFLLNFTVVTHILYRAFTGRPYVKSVVVPLVLLSIPMAVGIHTVTAFLYNGLAARPYWNSSILAPQFLASAFCSGPAILLIVLQLLRRFTRFEIEDEAIWKIAELMAYAMFFNLFLHGGGGLQGVLLRNTEHLLYTRYWYQGLGAHRTLVPYAWSAVALNVVAFVLFIVPAARRNWVTLNLGCLATYAGVYIEKGMGLIIPGLTPDTLGEIYEYYPTLTELRVAAGIFAVGFLVFTLMLKVAVPDRPRGVPGRPRGAQRRPRPAAARAGPGLRRRDALPAQRGERPSVYLTRPRAATGRTASTRSPLTPTSRSCRFATTQAWFGRMRTRSPTRKLSPWATAMTPCSSESFSMRLARSSSRPYPPGCGRRGSLDSVLLPASTTARSGAGTLTTVATTVRAQSSIPHVPSATWEASWNT